MDTNLEQVNDLEQKTYEIGYLLSPFISEDSVEEEVARIFKTAIEAAGGTMVTSPVPRLRKLAYSISVRQGSKHSTYTDAYFGALRYQAVPEAVAVIKESLDKVTEVVRYLTLSVPKNSGAMMLKMSGAVKVPTTPEVAEQPKEKEEKPEMSQAEIDKQIEGLLSPTV